MSPRRPPPCPICGEPMPAAHFLTCPPCMAEVPFGLRIERSTRMGRAYAGREKGSVYDRAAEERAVAAAEKAILAHLRQHGSAIP